MLTLVKNSLLGELEVEQEERLGIVFRCDGLAFYGDNLAKIEI